MEKFDKLEGVAAPLRIVNVDTDMIIPKQYLKTLKRTGLAKGLFSELRYKDDGSDNPDFVLNKPAYKNAKILVADNNFGCGSSREHAPQGLARAGFAAIIGESFSEIFLGNSSMIGMPCFTADREAIVKLQALVASTPHIEIHADVRSGAIVAGALRVMGSLPPALRDAFVSGQWDPTAMLLGQFDQVRQVAARQPYIRGF